MRKIIIAMSTLLVIGCCKSSDSSTKNNDKLLKCYSGGQLIFDGLVTDIRIYNNNFRVNSNGRRLNIQADCILSYDMDK